MPVWIAIFFFMLWITPIRMGATVTYRSGDTARGHFGVTIWGFAVRMPWKTLRDERGKLQFRFDRQRESQKADDAAWIRRVLRMLRAVRMGNLTRRMLRKSLSIEAFSLRARVGAPSAAATAYLCAALSALAFKHPFRIRVLPDFSGRNALDGLCIIGFRLGNLLVACALGASAYRKAGKEEKAWNIIPLTN